MMAHGIFWSALGAVVFGIRYSGYLSDNRPTLTGFVRHAWRTGPGKSNATMSESRIIVDVWRDGRAALLSALGDLPSRDASRMATACLYALRAAGLLRGWIEYHYTATALAELLARSDEYVMRLVRTRQIQPVVRDGRGWLIPGSSAQTWLDSHMFGKSTTFPSIGTGERGEKIPAIALVTCPGCGRQLHASQYLGNEHDLVASNPVKKSSSARKRKAQQTQGNCSSDAGSDAVQASDTTTTSEPATTTHEPSAGRQAGGGGGSGVGEPIQIHMPHNDQGFHS